MDKCELFDRIREIIADSTGISKEEITKEANLQSDLGLSSLQIFLILASVEEEFDILIDAVDLTAVVDMKDFIDLIALYVR